MPDRMPRTAGVVKPRRSRLLWVGLPVFAVFAVFAVVVWLGYQDNARLPSGEPPLIKATATTYKLAPDDPGGRQVADQGEINRLLREEPRPPQPERVLPLPEEPRAPVIPVAPVEPSEQAAAPDGTQDEPAGTATSGADEATEEAEAALARLLADVGPTSKAPPPAAPPATSVAMPAAPPATAPSSTAPAEAAQGGSEPPPAPASVPSREADAALTRLLAEVAGVPADEAAEPSPPPSSPTAAIAAIAPAARTGAQDMGPGYRIQLAAVRDQEDARRAWASLVDRLGPLVADHQPVYERADTVNGVFYRVQIGPFADGQAAERLCSEVQRHNASCFVVGP